MGISKVKCIGCDQTKSLEPLRGRHRSFPGWCIKCFHRYFRPSTKINPIETGPAIFERDKNGKLGAVSFEFRYPDDPIKKKFMAKASKAINEAPGVGRYRND